MTDILLSRPTAVRPCAGCGTELATTMLSCPACDALVHATELTTLATEADTLTRDGKLASARAVWQRALTLLPETSQQYAIVQERVRTLTTQLDRAPKRGTLVSEDASATPQPWWKRGVAGIVTAVAFALSKLKFLLLGLTKASTLFSMFAFFGIYWSAYGWPFAAGLVVSIYIHEMGHVAELRRLGVDARAPLFIPGVGALVMLKQQTLDPATDARIGLAGPIWGLGAGLAAYAVYLVTHIPIWGAIAHLTGYINLFNLIPIWQLDGSRGFHALTQRQRWMAVAVIAAMYLITRQEMLLIVGGVAIYRALQKTAAMVPDRRALVTYAGLIIMLAALSTNAVISR